ncbi:MAG: CehA/McbA family metallohydrolase [Gemmataceae bacterium]
MWKVAVGFFAALGFVPLMSGQAPQPEWPMKWGVEAQPLIAQTNRIASAMEILGQPLDPKIARTLKALRETQGNDAVAKAVQEALDPLCLAAVEVGPTGVTRVIPGRSVPLLVEQGWTLALVKVINQAGTTGILQPDSPSAKPIPRSPAADVENRWLGLLPHTGQPMLANLSGVGLEYTMVQLWSKNAETRSAEISFAIKGDKAKSGNAVAMARIGFQAKPSSVVTFRVTEFDGSPSMAGFTITDAQGRIFPSQAKRLAPDFFFQKQIYRADGETVRLPKGTYQVVCRRGPESIPETKILVVGDGPAHLKYTVARWIDPSTTGWWSGDHHIHAAGCTHYDNPTEGVEPADMMRHILGEDLKIGCCLTWGPCFDYQKRFFTGRPDTVSKPPYILRYDVEVSGFGSQSSGHLNLLRLKEQIYPGGESKHHWPTLGMNTLRWAKKQGAVCGPAHSANGLTRFVRRVPDTTDGPGGLPNFHIPAYDGIRAN